MLKILVYFFMSVNIKKYSQIIQTILPNRSKKILDLVFRPRRWWLPRTRWWPWAWRGLSGTWRLSRRTWWTSQQPALEQGLDIRLVFDRFCRFELCITEIWWSILGSERLRNVFCYADFCINLDFFVDGFCGYVEVYIWSRLKGDYWRIAGTDTF